MKSARSIRCKHCPRHTMMSEEAARFAGWRFYSGPSLTGKELNDVICPVCTGAVAPVTEVPTWVVECSCDWSSQDDLEPGESPILTAWEAERVSRDHRCEPMFTFITPEGVRYSERNKVFQEQVKETTPKRKGE